jgi:hypothetical protein
VAKFTLTPDAPLTCVNARSTRPAQLAQVIPEIGKSKVIESDMVNLIGVGLPMAGLRCNAIVAIVTFVDIDIGDGTCPVDPAVDTVIHRMQVQRIEVGTIKTEHGNSPSVVWPQESSFPLLEGQA